MSRNGKPIQRNGREFPGVAWEGLRLWPHQKDAIRMVRTYLDSVSHKQPRASLVQLPTGTGKTGIAAVLSTCFPDLGTVLVVTPAVVLREQMVEDLQTKFWRHIGVDPDALGKDIVELLPSTVDEQLKVSDDRVFVGTPQTLTEIHKSNPDAFDRLRSLVKLTIFDEGHREPAPRWAKAARALGAPVVLLSATPYRNDFRVFDVDPRSTYSYSYDEAVRDRYVREVQFEPLRNAATVKDFARQLVGFYHGEFQDRKPSAVASPRVIVRVATRDQVSEMTDALCDLGQSAVGVHERFTRQDNETPYYAMVRDVPVDRDPVFWVHQYKLLEGVDDYRFCLLAIYAPFGNDRSVVQQIGRIVRNPRRRKNQVAFVAADASLGIMEAWQRFRDNDRAFLAAVRPEGPAPRRSMVRTDPDFPLGLVVQPPTEYVGGHFSRPFDISDPKAYEALEFPTSTIVLRMEGQSLDLDNLQRQVCEEWIDHWRKPYLPGEPPDETTRIILYYQFRNSPLLQKDWYFIECTLGATIIRWQPPYLCFYDSGGLVPSAIDDLGQKVPSSELVRLFPEDQRSRIMRVGLSNTDLGVSSVRSRSLYAYSMGLTVPAVADHAHTCTTALGYTPEPAAEDDSVVRRYVGFRRGRITDTSGKPVPLPEYARWVDVVTESLGHRPDPLRLFRRYATPVDPPQDAAPRHILLDLFGYEERFRAGNVALELDDVGSKVDIRGWFRCKANRVDYRVQVEYDPERRRYNLQCDPLNNAFVHQDESVGVITWLNRNQSFRVVPRDPSGVIYAYGEFYHPTLRVGAGYDENQLDLARLLHAEPLLNGASSEKGNKCRNGTGWEDGSVFDLIDRADRTGAFGSRLRGTKVLVCDDMGTEVADFIAADTESNRVIFIHAKAFRTPQEFSASRFAEICSQAVKNLQFAHRYTEDKPPNLRRWGGSWKLAGVGEVNRRIRRPRAVSSPSKLWDQIRTIMRNPFSQLEVWIVLGNGISRRRFNRYVSEQSPKPWVIQTMYQLETTWSTVASIGATLRLFCRP